MKMTVEGRENGNGTKRTAITTVNSAKVGLDRRTKHETQANVVMIRFVSPSMPHRSLLQDYTAYLWMSSLLLMQDRHNGSERASGRERRSSRERER